MSIKLYQKFELIENHFNEIMTQLESELSHNYFVGDFRNIAWGDTLIHYDNGTTLCVKTYGIDITNDIDLTAFTITEEEKNNLTRAVKSAIYTMINDKLEACDLQGTPSIFKDSIDIITEDTCFCRLNEEKNQVLLIFKMNSHMNTGGIK